MKGSMKWKTRVKQVTRGNLCKCLIFIVTLHLNFNYSSAQTTKYENVYDFIVVGAGTAGSQIASKIANTGIYNVLLIEAGELPEPEWSIPALSFELYKSRESKSIKVYKTVPQRNAGLENNGSMDYVTSQVLGGSSSINGMIFNRGSPHDFSKWARDFYDNDWGYKKLLPFFMKTEKYAGIFPTDHHGYDGPITIGPSLYSPGMETWLQAGIELGYPVADPNGPQNISFAPVEWSQENGRRVSSYNAYIQPILDSRMKKNLKILTNTEATKLIFEGKRAIGVEYMTNSSGIMIFGEARVKKEIVISAGAIGTPLLLMKSGIGSRPVMDETKIPVVKYLTGVGRNLQNHLAFGMPVIINSSSEVLFTSNRDLNPDTWKTFSETGGGPYSSYGGLVGQAFLAKPSLDKYWKSGLSDGWPDIHLLYFHSPTTPFSRRYQDELEKTDLKRGESQVMVLVLVGRPQSHGIVKLDPENIDNPPIIDFRFLMNPADMQIALDGLKAIAKIVGAPAFKRLGARMPSVPLEACKDLTINSDEYFQCYIKQVSFAPPHATGTCRMGVGPTDHQAVVDTQLRVIGVPGLRIADASVMPNIVNSSPQAAVYAIGEKAADMILNTWIPAARLAQKKERFNEVGGYQPRYKYKLTS